MLISVRDMPSHRIRLLYVVGARPNFVKMAPVISALRSRMPDAEHVLVHTGQHYDAEMSELFLDQLGMPEPDHRLGVGSGSHATQTARVMESLEPIVLEHPPDLAFVPGDVNSTLAATLVFAKTRTPYAHVESGLRSFDRAMPEEINRIVADEFADLLFAHSDEALTNLAAEGIERSRVHLVGNTMIDTLLRFEERFRALRTARRLGLDSGHYLLVTLHRPSLVDGDSFERVLTSLNTLAGELPIVFPVHPRSRARIDERRFARIKFTAPLGYLEFLSVQSEAKAVLTDSGGVQEETTHLGVPCFTFRSTTERPVTTRVGTNTLLGVDPRRISSIPSLLSQPQSSLTARPNGWDGKAAQRIADIVEAHLASAGH